MTAADQRHIDVAEAIHRAVRSLGGEVTLADHASISGQRCMWATAPGRDPWLIAIVDPDSAKPAALLKTAIAAARWDTEIWIVGESKSTARRALAVLHEPYQSRRDDRTMLYTTETPVSAGADGQRVLPGGDRAGNWWLTPAGDLELRDSSGTLLVRHPAEDPLDDVALDTPVCRDDDGQLIVEAPDGTVLNRYASRGDLREEWTPLVTPLVPTRLTYADVATAKYVTADGDLATVGLSAPWDGQQRIQGAIDTFVGTIVVRGEGQLSIADVTDRLRTWMDPLTEHTLPSSIWVNRALASDLDRVSGDSGHQSIIEGVRWRYPPQLEPPIHSEIDITPPYREDWDDRASQDTDPTSS